MLRVHLYDCDSTGFPNLALLKLSAWHKAKGDEVTRNFPLLSADLNYYGAVFSWSPQPPPGDYIGPGNDLPDEIEHICPDYDGMDYSMGFLSRGCPNRCWFCQVPTKEGDIRPHSLPEEFIRHKKALLLDNNWLASPRWEDDWEWLKKAGIRCDFNQGLDSRLIDEGVARRLTELRWISELRLACDSQAMKEPTGRAIRMLRAAGFIRDISVYTLVTDVGDALDRVEYLRGVERRVYPFAQPYRDESGGTTREARQFARWVNHRAIFKSMTWDEYKGAV